VTFLIPAASGSHVVYHRSTMLFDLKLNADLSTKSHFKDEDKLRSCLMNSCDLNTMRLQAKKILGCYLQSAFAKRALCLTCQSHATCCFCRASNRAKFIIKFIGHFEATQSEEITQRV